MYDAWGNVVHSNCATGYTDLMNANPFRYRGYYFDTDTGLYYLNSRYYNPLLGRFINADAVEVVTATPSALTDKNLYAYCDNNPIMRVDADGRFWKKIKKWLQKCETAFFNAIELEAGVGYGMERLDLAGYDSFNVKHTDYLSLWDCKQQLEQCKVFLFRGHGGCAERYTYIVLANDASSFLASYNLYSFDQNIPTTDLSNCEIALFVGCETAAHATQSLHHAAVLAGAKVAIGFKDSIACSDANTWTETFVDEYSKGTSVTMAAQRAAQKCEDIRLYEYDFAFG